MVRRIGCCTKSQSSGFDMSLWESLAGGFDYIFCSKFDILLMKCSLK